MSPDKKEMPSTSAGYSDAAKTVLQEGASRVEEMHQAIAAQSFNVLKGIPGVAGAAYLVQQMHDVIAGGVYAAIRQGGGSLLDLAGTVERQALAGERVPDAPGRLACSVRSALNAAFGDHLASTNSVMAITMAIYRDGMPVAVEREALAIAYPAMGDRLCLFLHGLGYDEHCWAGDHGEIDIPRRLAADGGYTPLTLRYNTGLPIVENGAQLAVLLEGLINVWPHTLSELVVIGHSMGGLVARSACVEAAAIGCQWPGKVRMVICLGSPNLGAPLERFGESVTTALGLSAITEPLARVAAQRSQGIKDLRHGGDQKAEAPSHIAWRFIGGSLAEDPADPLGEIIGDGLVTLGSATAHGLAGDAQSARLGGVGHMGLLGDRRVYGQICKWLGVKPGARSKRRSGTA